MPGVRVIGDCEPLGPISDPLQEQYALLMLSYVSSPRRNVLKDKAARYWGRCLKDVLPILWVPPISGVSGLGNNMIWGSFYYDNSIDACKIFIT